MAEKTAVYKFEEFCLDCSNKVLERNDEPVPLTPKVFETGCRIKAV